MAKHNTGLQGREGGNITEERKQDLNKEMVGAPTNLICLRLYGLQHISVPPPASPYQPPQSQKPLSPGHTGTVGHQTRGSPLTHTQQ